MTDVDTVTEYRCSFCSMHMREVSALIAGPRVYICEGCVQLCCEILVERRAEGKLALLSDRADAMGKINAELQEVKVHAGTMRTTITAIARLLAATCPELTRLYCTWCEAVLADQAAAREHVATCEKHPAVIKLREATAPKRRTARAR